MKFRSTVTVIAMALIETKEQADNAFKRLFDKAKRIKAMEGSERMLFLTKTRASKLRLTLVDVQGWALGYLPFECLCWDKLCHHSEPRELQYWFYVRTQPITRKRETSKLKPEWYLTEEEHELLNINKH